MIIMMTWSLSHAEAASKNKGLILGLGGIGGGYTDDSPELPNDSSKFSFSQGISLGYVGDLFFNDDSNHALAFDLYLQFSNAESAGAIVSSTDSPPTNYACPASGNCRTRLKHQLNLYSFLLGYRYHFNGPRKSGGYLGVGGLFRFLNVDSERRVVDGIARFDTRGSGNFLFPRIRNYSAYDIPGPRTENKFSYAITSGYDWHIGGGGREHGNLVMGIHLLYTPPVDYGEITNIGGLMVGYTIGGVAGGR